MEVSDSVAQQWSKYKYELINLLLKTESLGSGLKVYVSVVPSVNVVMPNHLRQYQVVNFNITDPSVQEFELTEKSLSFTALFNGVVHHLFLPMEYVAAVFLPDTGVGSNFPVIITEPNTEGEYVKVKKPHLKLVH